VGCARLPGGRPIPDAARLIGKLHVNGPNPSASATAGADVSAAVVGADEVVNSA
jgi:hypothetical protein